MSMVKWTARTLASAIAGAALLASLSIGSAFAQSEKRAAPAFQEPVTLSSEGGVLEVTLTAHQGEVALDTASASGQERFAVWIPSDSRQSLKWR